MVDWGGGACCVDILGCVLGPIGRLEVVGFEWVVLFG